MTQASRRNHRSARTKCPGSPQTWSSAGGDRCFVDRGPDRFPRKLTTRSSPRLVQRPDVIAIEEMARRRRRREVVRRVKSRSSTSSGSACEPVSPSSVRTSEPAKRGKSQDIPAVEGAAQGVVRGQIRLTQSSASAPGTSPFGPGSRDYEVARAGHSTKCENAASFSFT